MTLTLLSTYPSDHQLDVAPDAELVVVLQTTQPTIPTLTLSYDGGVALTYASGLQPGSGVKRGFGAQVFAATGFLSVRLRPRRRADPGSAHTFEVASNDTVTQLDRVLAYTTADVATPLLDLAFRATRVDRPFGATPALDYYRVAMVSATRTRATVAALVQLFYRVYFSELRVFTSLLAVPASLIDQLDDVLGADVGAVGAIDVQLPALAPLWEPALQDLLALGATPDQLAPLRAAMAGGYPQERVAAACVVVLWGAALYARREASSTPLVG